MRSWARDGLQLTVDGRAVAPLELAASARDRRRGLLGRSGLDGALLIWPASSVHTIGMRFPLDVAFCDGSWWVVDVRRLPPGRISRLRLRDRLVVEAEAGSFATWGLAAGSRIGLRPV